MLTTRDDNGNKTTRGGGEIVSDGILSRGSSPASDLESVCRRVKVAHMLNQQGRGEDTKSWFVISERLRIFNLTIAPSRLGSMPSFGSQQQVRRNHSRRRARFPIKLLCTSFPNFFNSKSDLTGGVGLILRGRIFGMRELLTAVSIRRGTERDFC